MDVPCASTAKPPGWSVALTWTVIRLPVGAREVAVYSQRPDSAWTTILNQWTSIEVNFISAASAGSLTLWLNGNSAAALSSIENDSNPINKVQFGASGVETGTRTRVDSRLRPHDLEEELVVGVIKKTPVKASGRIKFPHRVTVQSGWYSKTHKNNRINSCGVSLPPRTGSAYVIGV